MSSQAVKMRKNLEKIRKEREIFEDKKSQLDAEMTKGRINMSKIKKGLRNKEIVDSPMDVSPSPTESISLNSTMTSPKQLHGQRKSKHLILFNKSLCCLRAAINIDADRLGASDFLWSLFRMLVTTRPSYERLLYLKSIAVFCYEVAGRFSSRCTKQPFHFNNFVSVSLFQLDVVVVHAAPTHLYVCYSNTFILFLHLNICRGQVIYTLLIFTSTHYSLNE